VINDLPYSEAGRRGQLDLYLPAGEDTIKDAPVLLQVHGGAWTLGAKEHQGRPLMNQMAAKGWICVAINYRLSPRATWPDHLLDCKRALAWVKEHIAEYGGDPDFVVITGGSAGGHLSSLVALTPNQPDFQPGFEDADTTVRACLSYYGVYDFTAEVVSNRSTRRRRKHLLEPVVMKRTLADEREAFEAASPIFQVNPDAPPFFVIHGRNDTLVPVAEARRFVARLREVSRSPVAYAELPGGQHAFEVFPSIRTAHVVNAAERFVDRTYTAYLAGRTQAASSQR
jgi:acetyl esterase/lipase